MLLVQQFTYIGAPHIWAGDEMGMWGSDDPSNRKPLIWPDIEFENEMAHPLHIIRPVDKVEFDTDLFNFYKQLIQIRNDHTVLSHGEIDFVKVDDDNEILVYSRFNDDKEVIVVFNNSNKRQNLSIPKKQKKDNYKDTLKNLKSLNTDGNSVDFSISPRTAGILISSPKN